MRDCVTINSNLNGNMQIFQNADELISRKKIFKAPILASFRLDDRAVFLCLLIFYQTVHSNANVVPICNEKFSHFWKRRRPKAINFGKDDAILVQSSAISAGVDISRSYGRRFSD